MSAISNFIAGSCKVQTLIRTALCAAVLAYAYTSTNDVAIVAGVFLAIATVSTVWNICVIAYAPKEPVEHQQQTQR